MTKFDIDEIEKTALHSLKDFQKATVERIDYLFRNGQKRVLVADEVGMGKTLIARGTIVKTARILLEEENRENKFFKVVYICSNQNIANQNIRKLDITNNNLMISVQDTRLSMQHLKITEQDYSIDYAINYNEKSFVQLVPLTPETSFKMTSGGGNVRERALMFTILKRMNDFKNHIVSLEKFMILDAVVQWDKWKSHFENRIKNCNKASNKKYLSNLTENIQNYEKYDEIKELVLTHLHEQRYNKKLTYSNNYVMHKLRVMFAQISVSMLEPDLVIMDEFQRFKFLLSSDDSDLGILSRNFLRGNSTRVLLLSATPYKLYSTLEEIEKEKIDEHYAEFYQVMDFLFAGNEGAFREIWKNYSTALNEQKIGDNAILNIKKQAEDAMYQGVCRTERISVMESGDYTDDSNVKACLAIQEGDIKSYLQLGKLLIDTDIKEPMLVDYVKSSPYLLSFMKNYTLKTKIERYFELNPRKVNIANKNMLWINKSKIDKYEELPKTNARLEALKEKAFVGGAEKYLWIPPSKPYYPLQGVYKNSKGFSKILVFSFWEMVPRMIGTMISYEAERRTIGKLSENTRYFAEGYKRYSASKLSFNVSKNTAYRMNMFCLMYPSKTLADMFSPIEALNENKSIKQIEKDLRRKISIQLKIIDKNYALPFPKKIDYRWYYLAPMLMDGLGFVNDWISDILKEVIPDDTEDSATEKGNKGFFIHIENLKAIINNINQIGLEKMPNDLTDTLVNMILGSPAICIYRSNGNNKARATTLSKIFVNNFNLTESMAIIDLAYGVCKNGSSRWKNILKYCKDGCFQAMFDEYQHILRDSISDPFTKDTSELIHNMMMRSLKIHTATYSVDTFSSFKSKIEGNEDKSINMRSSYAVGFTNDTGDNVKVVNRKESVRHAFNSPMRPFVLATTSIGQEGLDFHNYCKVIMHWNLPSNPIDLEQREGRINRFKCLAIRQNVANKYGNIKFNSDIWTEMFEAAANNERQDNQSELVPFWCFGKNQSVKIERLIPMYPISKDQIKYERLIKILSLYRITLGHARQEELLEYLFKQFNDINMLKDLFINLSPFDKSKL